MRFRSNSAFSIDRGEEMEAEDSDTHESTDGHASLPLLNEGRGRASHDSPSGSVRPKSVARQSSLRSSGTGARADTRRKYIYAAFFLLISLISFVVQTETAVYIQHELGWNKAYCMLLVAPSTITGQSLICCRP